MEKLNEHFTHLSGSKFLGIPCYSLTACRYIWYSSVPMQRFPTISYTIIILLERMCSKKTSQIRLNTTPGAVLLRTDLIFPTDSV